MEIKLSDVIAFLSALVSFIALYKSSQTAKEIFLNMLRENIKNIKHSILEIEEKAYTHIEKIRIIEKLHDLSLYQGYKNEKKRYLNKEQEKALSDIYIEIEDSVGCILSNCDVETNRNQMKENLNNLLRLF